MTDSSDRLINEDLAPSRTRTWGTYSITSVWFACLHTVAMYTTIAGFFTSGLNAWQVTVGCLLGFTVIYLGIQLVGNMGQRHGIPFPVLARISFGIFGANIPALVRAIVAVCWYGIMTYLASKAVMVLMISVYPGLMQFTKGPILGLTPLGWVCFLLLWFLQLIVISHGMETVRKFQNWAGAAISVVMLTLAGVLLAKSGGRMDFSFSNTTLSAAETVYQITVSAALLVATWGSLMLNFCDFSRFSPDQRSVRVGNLLGLPVFGTVFVVLVIMNTAAAHSIWGKVFIDPTELVAATEDKWLIVVCALIIVFATVGVNIIANLVGPSYDFANLHPRLLGFKQGAYITSVLALLVMPWNFYNSTAAIHYFLGGLGAFLGPLFGIIVTDYYVVKNRTIVLDDLFVDSSDGVYFYKSGYNPVALAAFIPSASIAALIALVPIFGDLSPYSWFIGSATSAAIYYFAATIRSRPWAPSSSVAACDQQPRSVGPS